MMNIPNATPRLIGRYFANHHDEFVGRTLRELAEEFGVSPGRMRAALRRYARPILADAGAVLTVPVSGDGSVQVVSFELIEVLSRFFRRFDPITTELVRHDEDITIVNGGVSLLDGVINALYDAFDSMADLVLAGEEPEA
jgi:hypothetical protein